MTPAGWITFIGVVITAVVSLVGARTSARAAREAAARAAELEAINLQLAARDNQVQSWRTDAEALREQRDAAEQAIEALRKHAADQQRLVARLRGRLQGLIRWARRVIAEGDAQATNLPGPPIDLGDTDPNGWTPSGESAGGGRR